MNKASVARKFTTTKPWFQLVGLGDLHIGHIGVDYTSLKNLINKLKRRTDCAVILMGDSIENAIPGSVSSQFEQDMTPEEQIDKAYELFEPIEHLIVGLHDGNHPYRTTKATGLSPEKIIAGRLKVPYLGHQALSSLNINGIVYDVFSCHGVSGARTATGKLAKILDMVKLASADVYMTGHIHDRVGYIQHYEMRVGKQTVLKKRAFVSAGSFVQYFNSYAERMLLYPGQIGPCSVSLGAQSFDISIQL